ncbi:MAG: ComF family protein [Bacteroidales bacterium]|jgi:ComF family protein|nr:ComF family protein [Bacteroidales bacterium]
MNGGWLIDLLELFYPRYCAVCDERLLTGEEFLCLKCALQMPKIPYDVLRERLYGRIPVDTVASWFEFKRGSPYRKLIHAFKYHGQKELAQNLGRRFGYELKRAGILTDAGMLCPVPLFPAKERKRGYNQSHQLAVGLSAALEIPVEHENLVRTGNTSTQTKLNRFERWENVRNQFCVVKPELFAGKHLILVDDVLTTGATVEACANAILNCCTVKLSVLTIAAVM